MSSSTLKSSAAKAGALSPAVERVASALVQRFNGIRKPGAIKCTCPICGFSAAKFDFRRKKLACKACQHDRRAGPARDYWHQADENGKPILGRAPVGVGELAERLLAASPTALTGQDDCQPAHELALAEGSDVVQGVDDDALECIAREVELSIDSGRKTAIETAVAIGHHLREAQQLLAGKGRDGDFRPWLKQRLQISHATAYKWIALADFSEKCQPGLHFFDLKAAYLLTSAKCPEATEDAVEQAATGVRITPKLAREIVEKYAPYVVPTDTARIDAAVNRIRALTKKVSEPQRAVLVNALRQLADEIEREQLLDPDEENE